ncbi:MAG: hypothetical protein ABI318_12925 [Chthoniobacteraceae bacterium]
MPGLRLLLGCFGLMLIGGCAAASKPGKGNVYYAVSAKVAQVYRFGPAQPTGADALLKQGQRVIMLRQEFGYSRVMTEDGMTGYIANDLIAPAPPPEKPRTFPGGLAWANLPPLPSRGTSVPGVSSANRAILESGPLFGEDKLPPLPDADGRNQKKQPGFRFNVRAPSAPGTDKAQQ